MSTIVLSPPEEQMLELGGLKMEYKIVGEQTGGSFFLMVMSIEPGRLVAPHVHIREDEYSVILEGEIGIRVGEQVIQATPGYTVFKPRGVRHTFWNAGPEPAKILEVISPAGFERFFVELAELERAGTFNQIEPLANRYGCSHFMDWVPELTAKYNLKLLGQ